MPGMLKTGSFSDTNMSLASWPKASTVQGDEGTWEIIWQWLVWDFSQLFQNEFAECDPWGGPLPPTIAHLAGQRICANDYFGVVWGVQGDHDFSKTTSACRTLRTYLQKQLVAGATVASMLTRRISSTLRKMPFGRGHHASLHCNTRSIRLKGGLLGTTWWTGCIQLTWGLPHTLVAMSCSTSSMTS